MTQDARLPCVETDRHMMTKTLRAHRDPLETDLREQLMVAEALNATQLDRSLFTDNEKRHPRLNCLGCRSFD